MIPAEALGLVRGLAVNFHDGPLPRYAGLNVTSWAILGRETTHGVTWHEMTARPDAGRHPGAAHLRRRSRRDGLLAQREVLRGRARVLRGRWRSRVAAGDTGGREQDLAGRSYFGRHQRPRAAAVDRLAGRGRRVAALVRALDFGPHPNPLALPKVLLGEGFVFVGRAEVTERALGPPAGNAGRRPRRRPAGRDPHGRRPAGRPPRARRRRGDGRRGRRDGTVSSPGRRLPPLDRGAGRAADASSRPGRRDPRRPGGRRSRASSSPTSISRRRRVTVPALAGRALEPALLERLPKTGRVDALVAAIAVLAARRSGTSSFDIAYGDDRLSSRVDGTHGAFPSSLPLRVTLDRAAPFAAAVAAVSTAREDLQRRGPHAADLWARDPALHEAARRGGLRAATVSVGVGVEPPAGRIRFALAARRLGLPPARRQHGGGSHRPARRGDRRRLRRAGATSRRDRPRHRGGAGSAPGDLERHGPPRPRGLHPRALLRAGEAHAGRHRPRLPRPPHELPRARRADEPPRAPPARPRGRDRDPRRHPPAPLLRDGGGRPRHAQGRGRLRAPRPHLPGRAHRLHGPRRRPRARPDRGEPPLPGPGGHGARRGSRHGARTRSRARRPSRSRAGPVPRTSPTSSTPRARPAGRRA